MVERSSHLERYQGMSPQERNAEMRQLFNFLPSFNIIISVLVKSNEGEEFILSDAFQQRGREMFERRRNSALRQILIIRLKTLLSFSAATDIFNSLVVGVLEHDFDAGIAEEMLEGQIFPDGKKWYADLFQWDLKSGGIFDEKEAKNIEQKAYRSAINQQRRLELVYEKGRAEDKREQELLNVEKLIMTEEELRQLEIEEQEARRVEEEDDGDLEDERRRKKFVGKWRNEFIEHYGDEP